MPLNWTEVWFTNCSKVSANNGDPRLIWGPSEVELETLRNTLNL
jgi:hypothetical protein